MGQQVLTGLSFAMPWSMSPQESLLRYFNNVLGIKSILSSQLLSKEATRNEVSKSGSDSLQASLIVHVLKHEKTQNPELVEKIIGAFALDSDRLSVAHLPSLEAEINFDTGSIHMFFGKPKFKTESDLNAWKNGTWLNENGAHIIWTHSIEELKSDVTKKKSAWADMKRALGFLETM